MGSFLRGKVCVGSVVSCSATRTHQFARDESCPISITTFQDSSSFESSSASDGQYNSSGLLAEEILLLCLLSHIHLVVRHIPGTFNVLADCLSRFHNPVNTEWELRQVVFDSVVLRWDRPHVDLFATSLNHKLETFVSPVPDPLSFAVDAMSLSWDGMFAYAFPPFRFLLQDQAIRLQDHSYCTSLAKTSMVSRTSASVLCQASETSFQTRSSVSVQGKSGTPKARVSSSSRLATLREGLRQKGFSEGATSHISKSVRQSTGIVYEAKWAIFCDWCSGRDIDPV